MASVGNPIKSTVGDQVVLTYPNDDDVAVGLAAYVAELSKKYTEERGAFTVVLSGGYLIACLRKLLEDPYVNGVDWGKWHVFWVDERVVPKTHDDSNYKLACDGFLNKVNIPESQIYAINDALDAEGAAYDYEKCLQQLVETGVLEVSKTTKFPGLLGVSETRKFPRFDLMLLGMGSDGHLASLFPHHPLLKEKTRWVTYIKNSPKPPPVRITFTFPVIDASANIAMVVVGPGEVDAVKKALGPRDNTSDLLPVQMVSLGDGKFTWFTDEVATSKLH